jgi:hypothetical protein
MWTLVLVLATALAGDGSVKETLAAGDNATTVFAKTTLTKVGNVKSGETEYELRCGTVSSVKSCAAYDKAGKQVAMTTAVTTDATTNGFTATFPDTFVVKTVTYDVKK